MSHSGRQTEGVGGDVKPANSVGRKRCLPFLQGGRRTGKNGRSNAASVPLDLKRDAGSD